MPAGIYVVAAELSGFAPFSSDPVSVGQGATTTLDVTLRLPSYGDTLVVTGSRAPEALRTAPVAVTVLRSAELETTPATNYSDLLRSVPGVNVIELSTRDVQIVTRGATGRNARSTLALLDGRSIYQDYFGMVLWDLLPVGLDEVKQVEVARGPGSAIWGANALTGAINIITKSPREMLGHARERWGSASATPRSRDQPRRPIGQGRLQAERVVLLAGALGSSAGHSRWHPAAAVREPGHDAEQG